MSGEFRCDIENESIYFRRSEDTSGITLFATGIGNPLSSPMVSRIGGTMMGVSGEGITGILGTTILIAGRVGSMALSGTMIGSVGMID